MSISEKQRLLEERMNRLGLQEEDLVEKFIGGSGPGGQKINKTASRVYLKHLPSGIEVQCQAGRSQSHNRFRARALLCDRIEERLRHKKLEKQRVRARERFRKKKRSAAQKKRIRAEKEKRSEKKRRRRRVSGEGG